MSGMVNNAEIKRRREALGLTMQEAAERAGMRTKMDWNKIEKGISPSATALYRVATALGCPMEALMNPIKPVKRK